MLALERANGGDIFDSIVRRQQFSEDCARLAFAQMASAVAALHAVGIVHRDLKPDNVLLREPGDAPDAELLLCDFGLAFDMATPDTRYGFIGTHKYCSPQICRDFKYSPAGDVWALGVILFVMLGGYFPFDVEPTGNTRAHEDADSRSLTALICGADVDAAFQQWPVMWKNVSASARDLIKRLLVANEADRITMADVLRHPWIANVAPRSLLPGVATLRPLVAREKLRKVVRLITAANRFRHLGGEKSSPLAGKAAPRDGVGLDAFVTAFRHAAGGESEIDIDGLRAVMLELGVPQASIEDLFGSHHIFEAVDVDHNGKIDWREFLALVPLLSGSSAVPLRDLSNETLKLFFSVWDSSGDGKLDSGELANMLAALHVDPHTSSSREIEAVLVAAQEGRLGWEEFAQILRGEGDGALSKSPPAMPSECHSSASGSHSAHT